LKEKAGKNKLKRKEKKSYKSLVLTSFSSAQGMKISSMFFIFLSLHYTNVVWFSKFSNFPFVTLLKA
jgi:hypothetical protein